MCKKGGTTIPPALHIVRDLRKSDSPPPPSQELLDEDGEPLPPPPKKRGRKPKLAASGDGGLQGLDITFLPLETHYQKAMAVLDAAGEELSCDICFGLLAGNDAVVCNHAFCEHAAHITCLSSQFLKEEGIGGSILPVDGSCPGCKQKTRWGDLARELSLRTRTKPKEKKVEVKEVKEKKVKEKKPAAVKKTTRKEKAGAVVEEEEEEEEDSDDEEDENEAEMSCIDVGDIPEGMEAEAMEASMMLDGLSDSEYDAVEGFLQSVDFRDSVVAESVDGGDLMML